MDPRPDLLRIVTFGGLAAGGERGVDLVFELLSADVRRTTALLGARATRAAEGRFEAAQTIELGLARDQSLDGELVVQCDVGHDICDRDPLVRAADVVDV